MKTNRDYPLSSTPTPKGNGELDTLISKAKTQLNKAMAKEQATPVSAIAAKKERQNAVSEAESYYASLLKKKKG